MKIYSKFIKFSFIAAFLSIYFSGCVNVEQKTVLKPDGSGKMNIKYWTKSTNVQLDEVGVFGFTEAKVRDDFSSANSEVTDVDVDNNTKDSIITVKVKLKFKDINKISEARSFTHIKASWEKIKDTIFFKYTLLQDSADASFFGAGSYNLNYVFDFPGEVISSNGKNDGGKVTWNKTLADLKNDIEFKATMIPSKCGIFGIELPVVFVLGMSTLILIRKKRKK